MKNHKYKIGQKVIISSVEQLSPWREPSRKLGFTFVITRIKLSYPSETVVYGYGSEDVAAEANLSLFTIISKIKTISKLRPASL
jgi:hypothetical protein